MVMTAMVVLCPVALLAKGMAMMPRLRIQAVIAEPSDVIVFERMPCAPLAPAFAKTVTAAMVAAMAMSLPMTTAMMTTMPFMMMPCLMRYTGA